MMEEERGRDDKIEIEDDKIINSIILLYKIIG